jgi:hypothetical protein
MLSTGRSGKILDGRKPITNRPLIQAMQSWGQADCLFRLVTDYGVFKRRGRRSVKQVSDGLKGREDQTLPHSFFLQKFLLKNTLAYLI